MSSSNNLASAGNWANVKSGETHVLYASLGLMGAGIGIVLYAWKTANQYLLVLGIVILMGALGIATDVWAHGYSH